MQNWENVLFQNICCWQQDQAVLRAAGGGQLEEGGRGDHVQGEHEEPARDHAGGGSHCFYIISKSSTSTQYAQRTVAHAPCRQHWCSINNELSYLSLNLQLFRFRLQLSTFIFFFIHVCPFYFNFNYSSFSQQEWPEARSWNTGTLFNKNIFQNPTETGNKTLWNCHRNEEIFLEFSITP